MALRFQLFVGISDVREQFIDALFEGFYGAGPRDLERVFVRRRWRFFRLENVSSRLFEIRDLGDWFCLKCLYVEIDILRWAFV